MRNFKRKGKLQKRRVRNFQPHPLDAVVFDVLHEVRNLTSGQIRRGSAVDGSKSLSYSTIRKIRLGPAYGGTRLPRVQTLVKMLKAKNPKLNLMIGEEV